MNKTGLIKQVLIIFAVSLIVALVVNAINPQGISVFDDGSRYSKDNQDKTVKDVINNPYDTSKNNQPQTLDKPPNVSKEGYVKPQNISLELTKVLFDKNALFIDARNNIQYDSGHVKGAINIPYGGFVSKSKDEKLEMMRKFNKEGSIVCYCSGGECEISIDLAYEFAKLGFNYVNIYRGGYEEWKNAGYPIEK
jgi:rhodanese-related sulfurtransferase